MYRDFRHFILLIAICISFLANQSSLAKKNKNKYDQPDLISEVKSIIAITSSTTSVQGSISNLYDRDLFKIRIIENGVLTINDESPGYDPTNIHDYSIFSVKPYQQFYKFSETSLTDRSNYLEKGDYILKVSKNSDRYSRKQSIETGYDLKIKFSKIKQADDHGGNTYQKYSNTVLDHTTQNEIIVNGNFAYTPNNDVDIFKIIISKAGYYSVECKQSNPYRDININLTDDKGVEYLDSPMLAYNGDEARGILPSGEYSLVIDSNRTYDYKLISKFEEANVNDLRKVKSTLTYEIDNPIKFFKNAKNKSITSVFAITKTVLSGNRTKFPLKKRIEFNGLISKYHFNLANIDEPKFMSTLSLHNRSNQGKYILDIFPKSYFSREMFSRIFQDFDFPRTIQKSVGMEFTLKFNKESSTDTSVKKIFFEKSGDQSTIDMNFNFGLKPARGRFKIEISPYEPQL